MFKKFLSVINPLYKPICRKTIKKRIKVISSNVEETIRKNLSVSDAVNTTVYIWTDRKMRLFLGITAHIINEEGNKLKLNLYTFACEPFVGMHTGKHILNTFEKIVYKYLIVSKVEYIKLSPTTLLI
ncbi:unnamed protein product [Clavelina lepadiformis]|uniref:Uncharacterized protein n=1 Tax=Clavelina lepadiformis TaxID=159417 RepID=A0ABP0H1N2_CLALP